MKRAGINKWMAAFEIYQNYRRFHEPNLPQHSIVRRHGSNSVNRPAQEAKVTYDLWKDLSLHADLSLDLINDNGRINVYIDTIQANTLEERLNRLEKRSELAIASYIFLSDLLLNINTAGTITPHVINYTIEQALLYLKDNYGARGDRFRILLAALVDPEGAWE